MRWQRKDINTLLVECYLSKAKVLREEEVRSALEGSAFKKEKKNFSETTTGRIKENTKEFLKHTFEIIQNSLSTVQEQRKSELEAQRKGGRVRIVYGRFGATFPMVFQVSYVGEL